jgi:hypothetical protein
MTFDEVILKVGVCSENQYHNAHKKFRHSSVQVGHSLSQTFAPPPPFPTLLISASDEQKTLKFIVY